MHSELTSRAGGGVTAPFAAALLAARPPISIASSRQAVAQAPQAPQPSLDHRAQQLDLGDQPEQGAQRAQVAAPEAVGEHVQQDDREQHEEQRDCLLVARLDGRQHGAAEGLLDPAGRRPRSAPRSCRHVRARPRGRRSRG